MGNGPQGWKRKKALIPLALLAVLAALGAGLYLRHWMMEARVNIDTFYPGVTVISGTCPASPWTRPFPSGPRRTWRPPKP